MTVEDQISGEKRELREAFKVVDPLPEPAEVSSQSASTAPPPPTP